MDNMRDEAFEAYGATWSVCVSYPAIAVSCDRKRLAIGTYGEGDKGPDSQLDGISCVSNVYKFESLRATRAFVDAVTNTMSGIESGNSVGEPFAVRVTVELDRKKTTLGGLIGPASPE